MIMINPNKLFHPNGYSRNHPSPNYAPLLDFYRSDGHSKATRIGSRDKIGLERYHLFAELTRRDFCQLQIRSLLDYGCGPLSSVEKERAFWHSEGVFHCDFYDPGIEESPAPSGQYDAVFCAFVLEHCDPLDVPWIFSEIASYSRKYLWVALACYPSLKALPDGRNAHLCLASEREWLSQIVEQSRAIPELFIRFTSGIKDENKGVYTYRSPLLRAGKRFRWHNVI
jgi:hypothetical protein